jgi:hypothetical protein
MVGVGVAGSGPMGGSVGSRVGEGSASDVGDASPVGEASTVGDGGARVAVGSGVQVGTGVGSAGRGPGKATMIKLTTMLAAISTLRIKMTVWLKLRFWRLRRRLLTGTYLLTKGPRSHRSAAGL